jgi:UDP-N-acetylmuramate--alanine ligase
MNILDYKLYYFLGAGGIGMSALVRYFNHYEKTSFGYDKVQSNLTEQLQKEGTQLHFTEDVELVFDNCNIYNGVNLIFNLNFFLENKCSWEYMQ